MFYRFKILLLKIRSKLTFAESYQMAKRKKVKTKWNLFFSNYGKTRKPASRVFLAPPEGLTKFLSSLYHAWQLLLAKFFDLVKLEFWPSGPPEPPGGQGSNLNSLFRALRWEGFALSIWFGYYKRFPRTLKHSAYTDKPKSTRKYLFDRKNPHTLLKIINQTLIRRLAFCQLVLFSCRIYKIVL